MGQPTKSKSFILTSCLVAVSFAIINCQKAPNRNGVKPNVQTPAGTNAKVEETGKSECSADAKKAVDGMRAVKTDASTPSKDKSETEKNNLIEKRATFIKNADALVIELDKLPEKACLINTKLDTKASDTDKKNNNISMTETKNLIENVKKLQAEDKGETPTPIGPAPDKAEEQRKKDRKEKNDAAIAYLKSNLRLETDEIKDMSTDNKDSNFKKFLIDGEIKSEKLLESANTNKSVICALSGDKVDKVNSKSVIMTFLGTEYTTIKGDDAVEGFKGEAITVLLTRKDDKSERSMVEGAMTPLQLKLTCLNMKASEMNVSTLKKALGVDRKHFKQISEAEFNVLKTKNEARVTTEIAASRNNGGNGGASGAGQGQQQQGQGQQQQGQGGAAPVAAAEDKITLVAAAIAARIAVDAQKAKIADLDIRQKAATAEVNAASDELTTKGVAGVEFTALAKRLKELTTEVEKALAAQTEAEKGSDAAKKAAGEKVTAAKQALSTAETDALNNKIKSTKAGTVKDFMDMQNRSSKLTAAQASLDADLAKAKEALPALEVKLSDAINKAKAKGAIQDEIDGKVEVK